MNAIIVDKGYTTLILYHGFFPKGIIKSANTASITATCPSSTPILKDKIVAGHPLAWKGARNTITCSSIHSFKGLESDVVILVEIDGITEKDKLMYVGDSTEVP